MVEWCRRYNVHAPVWGIWLDGDEVLLWPELLRDMLVKAYELHPDSVSMSIKMAEWDGQVYDIPAKVIRLDLVEAVLESSYQLKLHGSETVLSLPNSIASAPPVAGVPHLLHRSLLRPEGRREERLHLAESEFFESRVDGRIMDEVKGART